MIKSSRSVTVSRRDALFAGGVALSGAAVALLAGRPALAAQHAGSQAAQKDASVINTAVEFSILWPIISPICHSTRPVNLTVSP
jgi:hypothetical protein